jgi:threonine dehydratase
VRLVDQPGQLLKLLEILARDRVNILNIDHHRAGLDLSVNQAEVQLTLETRDQSQCQEILAALLDAGYEVWEAR